jgi:hypothetical protein
MLTLTSTVCGYNLVDLDLVHRVFHVIGRREIGRGAAQRLMSSRQPQIRQIRQIMVVVVAVKCLRFGNGPISSPG